jgi:hypothetical protein
VLLFRKLVLVDGCGGEVMGLAQRAAYHTSGTLNQNIVIEPKDMAGHMQGKMDGTSGLYSTLQLKENAAGGDVSGADISMSVANTVTGNSKGNLTAQRTSCRPPIGLGVTFPSICAIFFIRVPITLRPTINLAEFGRNKRGKKLFFRATVLNSTELADIGRGLSLRERK